MFLYSLNENELVVVGLVVFVVILKNTGINKCLWIFSCGKFFIRVDKKEVVHGLVSLWKTHMAISKSF